MKIDAILPGSNIAPSPRAEKTEGNFSEFLRDALAPAGSAPNNTLGIFNHPAIAYPIPQNLTPLHSEGLARGERVLNSLDSYAASLADNRQTLKQVEAKMLDMENELQGLATVLDGLGPNDQLAQILQEIISTATVESIKYRRGDFV